MRLERRPDLLRRREISLIAQRHKLGLADVASFQIMAVIGRLTAPELGLAVTVYDPDTDYRKVRNRWFGLAAPGAE